MGNATMDVTIAKLQRHELDVAAAVLARAYRDNPLTIVIMGNDPARRLRRVECVLAGRLAVAEEMPLVARRGSRIVGVCGMAPPGTCQPSPRKLLRLLPALLRGGPSVVRKVSAMRAEWDRREPKEPHWHLGPVGVEPALQRMGAGGEMMRRFCALVDDEGAMAWLDTDRAENVRFYERFGFVVKDTAEVIGVPNWFMQRAPIAQQGAAAF